MELYGIYADGMVFQRGKPIRIAGTGAGEASASIDDGVLVRGSFDGTEWALELPAMEAGGPHILHVTLNGERTDLTDILIGDVFLCAGQSNMEFKLSATDHLPPYEGCSRLRLHVIPRLDPQAEELYGGWHSCTPENAGKWSAIGYEFGLRWAKEKRVPVGIVGCYQGASIIETWIEKELLTSEQLIVPLAQRMKDAYNPKYFWNSDGMLYEQMFRAAMPVAYAAVVWYQGESNTSVTGAAAYGIQLAVLVHSWRRALRDRKLPFAIVILHNYEWGFPGWGPLQLMQRDTVARIEHALPVEAEVPGDGLMIHPVQKQIVGGRVYDAVCELLKQ